MTGSWKIEKRDEHGAITTLVFMEIAGVRDIEPGDRRVFPVGNEELLMLARLVAEEERLRIVDHMRSESGIAYAHDSIEGSDALDSEADWIERGDHCRSTPLPAPDPTTKGTDQDVPRMRKCRYGRHRWCTRDCTCGAWNATKGADHDADDLRKGEG